MSLYCTFTPYNQRILIVCLVIAPVTFTRSNFFSRNFGSLAKSSSTCRNIFFHKEASLREFDAHRMSAPRIGTCWMLVTFRINIVTSQARLPRPDICTANCEDGHIVFYQRSKLPYFADQLRPPCLWPVRNSSANVRALHQRRQFMCRATVVICFKRQKIALRRRRRLQAHGNVSGNEAKQSDVRKMAAKSGKLLTVNERSKLPPGKHNI